MMSLRHTSLLVKALTLEQSRPFCQHMSREGTTARFYVHDYSINYCLVIIHTHALYIVIAKKIIKT